MVNSNVGNGSIIESRFAVRIGICAFPAQLGPASKIPTSSTEV